MVGLRSDTVVSQHSDGKALEYSIFSKARINYHVRGCDLVGRWQSRYSLIIGKPYLGFRLTPHRGVTWGTGLHVGEL
jgi:hypothetical protein